MSAREKAAPRPRHLAQAEHRRLLGEPGGKDGVLSAGAPADERQPAAAPQRLAQVGERRRRVIEEHYPEAAQRHVEDPGPEPVHLDIGDLEPGISDASSSGEPTRLGYLNPGKIRAQHVPATGGARRQDSRLTAAAPDVENVLPILDRRGGQQPRPQPAQHPLMPLTLLDELPPAGPVPVLGLLHIRRHEGHATSPHKAPSGTFMPQIATVARACQSGEFCAQPRARGRA